MKINDLNRLIMACGISLLTACASTPPTHFYTLEAQSQHPAVTNSTTTKKLLIGIGPLSLPALLDRSQIVTRTENNTIEMADFDQWAAPLKENVIAVLSKNVATLKPNMTVRGYPWSVYGNMDYRVIIDITRFDTLRGKSVNLEANWAIMEEKNHTIVSNGQTKIEQRLNDEKYLSVAQGLSKLLSDFSQQIALALVQITP